MTRHARKTKKNLGRFTVWKSTPSGRGHTLGRFRTKEAAKKFACVKSLDGYAYYVDENLGGGDNRPIFTFHGGRSMTI